MNERFDLELPAPPTERGGWVERIGAAWGRARDSVLATGRALLDAKGALVHGEFEAMIAADLPFSASTAQRLMKIAADQRLWNPAHVQLLPPAWGTLYELTKLDDGEFQQALIAGAIRPDMERNDVLRLRQVAAAEAAHAVRETELAHAPAGRRAPDLAALTAAGGRYGVILADPPWAFEAWSDAGKGRSAENHYPTMTGEELFGMAEDVQALAADDCALLMWVAWPQLELALALIRAWGFEFKTCGFLWAKQTAAGNGFHVGLGYWTRANSEPCLLATRGSPQRLANDVAQLVVWPVAEHSRKPDEVHERIERLLAGPYLELFARRTRPGWTAWGNDVTAEGAS